MSKKLSYTYVKNYFKSQGCKLLEDVYINSRTKMRYKCSCGNKSHITFGNFQKGHRCKKCGEIRKADNKRLSYKYVEEYFKNQGCKLISKTYKNNSEKLKFICNCGNPNVEEVSFNAFKKGSRCNKCKIIRQSEKVKLSYEDVKEYFKSQRCLLISKSYKGINEKLKFICNCGNSNIEEITFNHFKHHYQRCSKCGLEKRKKTLRINNEKNGIWTPLEDLNNFELYRRNVHSLSNLNYRKHKDVINPLNLPRGRNKYHLDHKFSVFEGFKNNIPPYIIANLYNLQMLSENENCVKHVSCSITKKELMNKFFKGI